MQIEGATPIVGFDVAGVVEEVGFETDRFKVGDRVWGFSDVGGLAEYVAHPSGILGLLPPAPAQVAAGSGGGGEEDPINMSTIGSVPTVALTMMGAFRRAGAPWAPDSNTTVLITAGTGGTGYELAMISVLCVAVLLRATMSRDCYCVETHDQPQWMVVHRNC